ncbi:glycoside hydrolase family 5 protein [Botryobasidium botryosum FD-172 SS1]|uniref:glucan 1,3-beta-glucosidase n=1 Tax=Botryobasidium botryosum (strain FD-172 SS1) TaxID=930990 RepID=A0A067MJ89_BOTB1|nr:glycoside hydrolase family 5 protein [Botryobasidium botryosum FD-172 SS1]
MSYGPSAAAHGIKPGPAPPFSGYATLSSLQNPSNRGSNTALVGGLGQQRYWRGASSHPLLQNEMPEGRRVRSFKRLLLVGGAALIAIVLAVVLGVYFGVVRPKQNTIGEGELHSFGGPDSGSGGKPPTFNAITGGDGSKIVTEDGSTFTYHNSFGGYWVSDPNNPFNDGARAQSWSPALNETFRYGIDKIRGVNIGGWLNTEPFISPTLYQEYQKTPTDTVPGDEWALSTAMAADGALATTLENHYMTFITEEDFAQIAGAGLNYVRIPLPFWAIEVRDNEPFLPKVSWKYFLKAIQWARKYGLRINLDLHAVPGSQNGYNHSGKGGQINFLNGAMGFPNAQRTLDYIRILAEFISQPEYKNVVTMFGVLNEPLEGTIGIVQMNSFYYQAHQIIRKAGGIGEGSGPWISMHNAWLGADTWANFMPGGDRLALDSHPYFTFDNPLAPPLSAHVSDPCKQWGGLINGSMSTFGMSYAGEWSNGWNDCGLFLNGVGAGTRYEGTFPGSPATSQGNCKDWTDWASWTADTKSQIKQFAMSSMDAFGHSFFWTWKIANSTAGKVESPLWSYQLGLQNGWMPTDPREADGTCKNASPFGGLIAPPARTGGVGAGTIDPAWAASYSAWPPASINGAGAITAAYTPMGPIPTLPVPTFTQPSGARATINTGSGWTNNADDTPMAVAAQGCTYPDSWVPAGVVPACAAVGGGGTTGALPSMTRAETTTRPRDTATIGDLLRRAARPTSRSSGARKALEARVTPPPQF